tara:strand:- start:301 stop:891 length:591 start_codon:yes stop_codon:yes gene_type:complete
MTHDFAKIKPEPILERTTIEPPPTWSLLLTGCLVGMTLGVLGCVLFYLSGHVPPLNIAENVESGGSNKSLIQDTVNTSTDDILDFEFYTELPKYEVQTTSVPVVLDDPKRAESQDKFLDTNVMLQTGAFQQISSAEQEMKRQTELGLKAAVKPAKLPGRTLYLVQNGPYSSEAELEKARQLLKANNITSLVVKLQD